MTTAPLFLTDERLLAYGCLVESQRRLSQVFDRSLREAGISVVWYEALLRLALAPGRLMPVTDLGDKLQLTSGGATRLVDRLEETGYIERVACPTDRRVSWARLTDRGFKKLEAATAIHLDQLDQRFSSRLSPEELRTLSELLERAVS